MGCKAERIPTYAYNADAVVRRANVSCSPKGTLA